MSAVTPLKAFAAAYRRGGPWDPGWFGAPMLRDRAARWVTVKRASALLCRAGADGLFSLPTADSEHASEALVGALLREAQALGCASVRGPVSPAVYDFCRGLRIEGEQTPFDYAVCPGLCGALERNGFQKGPLYDLFRLRPDEAVKERQRRVSREVTRRFFLRDESFSRLGDDVAARAMASVAARDPRLGAECDQTLTLLRSLGRTLDRKLSRVVFRGNDPAAYVLAARKAGTLRVATAQVIPSMRRMGLTAARAAPILDLAGVNGMELGVIREDNLPSLACARALGAELSARYALFHRNIGDIR